MFTLLLALTAALELPHDHDDHDDLREEPHEVDASLFEQSHVASLKAKIAEQVAAIAATHAEIQKLKQEMEVQQNLREAFEKNCRAKDIDPNDEAAQAGLKILLAMGEYLDAHPADVLLLQTCSDQAACLQALGKVQALGHAALAAPRTKAAIAESGQLLTAIGEDGRPLAEAGQLLDEAVDEDAEAVQSVLRTPGGLLETGSAGDTFTVALAQGESLGIAFNSYKAILSAATAQPEAAGWFHRRDDKEGKAIIVSRVNTKGVGYGKGVRRGQFLVAADGSPDIPELHSPDNAMTKLLLKRPLTLTFEYKDGISPERAYAMKCGIGAAALGTAALGGSIAFAIATAGVGIPAVVGATFLGSAIGCV